MKQGIYNGSKTLKFETSQYLKPLKCFACNGWVNRSHQITFDQEKTHKMRHLMKNQNDF